MTTQPDKVTWSEVTNSDPYVFSISYNTPSGYDVGGYYGYTLADGVTSDTFNTNVTESIVDGLYFGLLGDDDHREILKVNAGNSVGVISGDFIDSQTGAWGFMSIYDAIMNEGTVGTIAGDFIKSGDTAVYNSGKVGNITGDFISHNQAISNNGVIGKISGDFAENGAMSSPGLNNSGIINEIEGTFVDNMSDVEGFIRNYNGTIGKISGDFIHTGGYAIYNDGGSIGRVNSNFLYSYYGVAVNNSSGTIGNITGDFISNEEGAINNSSGTIGLLADTRNILFYNNGDYDIYNDDTVNLSAKTGQSINFGGDIEGYGTLNINTDATNFGGNYNFNNEVTYQTLNLGTTTNKASGAQVNLGSILQSDGTTTYGHFVDDVLVNNAASMINMQNRHVGTGEENSLDTLTLNENLKLGIDVSLNSSASAADTLNASTIDGVSGKKVIVDAINMVGTTYNDGAVQDSTTGISSKTVNFVNDENMAEHYALASDILSNITGNNYYTSVELDDDGNMVFSNKLVNESMLQEALAGGGGSGNPYVAVNPVEEVYDGSEWVARTPVAADARGYGDIAIGDNAIAGADQDSEGYNQTYATALGYGADAARTDSIAIGHDAKAYSNHSIALGGGAEALSPDGGVDGYNIAIGYGTSAGHSGEYATVLGALAKADQDYDTAIGYRATIGDGGTYSTALGALSSVGNSVDYAVALGYGSEANENSVVSVGSGYEADADTYQYRRIVNVADGIDDHDAVTVGQLGFNISTYSTVKDYVDSVAGGGGSGNPYVAVNPVEKVYNTQTSQWVARDPVDADARGYGDIAIGDNAIAGIAEGSEGYNRSYSTAIGYKASAANVYATALGYVANATGTDAIAIGRSADAIGTDTIAIGREAYTTGTDSIAIGHHAHAQGNNSVAIGLGIQADKNESVAIGHGAVASGSGDYITVLGASASAVHQYGTAVGYDAEVGDESEFSTALGARSSVSDSVDYAVALGYGSVASSNSTVSVGSGDSEHAGTYQYRRIVNVAAGENAHDAVIVDQLGFNLSTYSTVKAYVDSAAGNPYVAVNPVEKVYNGSEWVARTPVAADARGYGDIAIGDYAIAGIAEGDTGYNQSYSIALGYGASAANMYSTALGYSASADGTDAIAIGQDADAIGTDTLAIGYSAYAERAYDIALGYEADAGSGSYAIALGYNAHAWNDDAIAIGRSADTTGTYAIAIGHDADAIGTDTLAIGQAASAYNDYSVALGTNANTGSGSYATALGANAKTGQGGSTSGDYAVALGYNATVYEDYSVAIGSGANTGSGAYAMALGANAKTGQSSESSGDYTVALGYQARADGNNSVALGAGSYVRDSEENVISVGRAAGTYDSDDEGLLRKIINVAAGENAHDAVIVDQLGFNLSTYSTVKAYVDSVAGGGGSGNPYVKVNSTGNAASVGGTESIAIGSLANTEGRYYGDAGNYSIALGYTAYASGDESIAIGKGATTLGSNTYGTGDKYNIAIGTDAYAGGSGGYITVLGADAGASLDYDTAIGYHATVEDYSEFSTALGANSSVGSYKNYAVALGYGSEADESSVVSVGSGRSDDAGKYQYRRIVNVADGTADHDAATVGQVKGYFGDGLTYNTTTGQYDVTASGGGDSYTKAEIDAQNAAQAIGANHNIGDITRVETVDDPDTGYSYREGNL